MAKCTYLTGYFDNDGDSDKPKVCPSEGHTTLKLAKKYGLPMLCLHHILVWLAKRTKELKNG